MSIVTVKRPPRADPPRLPDDQVELQEPPVMAEPAQPDLRAFLMVIPMGLGMGGMFLIFGMTNRSPAMYVMGILMAGGMVAMGAMQMGRNAAERKTKMRSERRDFLRYIAQIRKKARQAAQEQRQAVLWNNPDPSALWSVAMGSRIWERRASHDDFGRVRIGLGRQGSSVQYMAPATKPIEDLEPLSSISLRRFSEAYRTVAGVPIAVGLRSFTSVELEGETAASLGLVRAMLAQLVTFHAPDELRIAVLCGDSVRDVHWDWVKWLPHNAHPSAEDARRRPGTAVRHGPRRADPDARPGRHRPRRPRQVGPAQRLRAPRGGDRPPHVHPGRLPAARRRDAQRGAARPDQHAARRPAGAAADADRRR